MVKGLPCKNLLHKSPNISINYLDMKILLIAAKLYSILKKSKNYPKDSKSKEKKATENPTSLNSLKKKKNKLKDSDTLITDHLI